MTATPTAAPTFASKYGDFVRKAGSKFGFDLAGLFEDTEEGSSPFDGFAPSFSMQTMQKGRPGSLTYTTPKTQARISEFSLTPEGTGSTVGSATGGTPQVPAVETPEEEKVKEKADRLLSSFIGPSGSAGEIGAMGIGRAQEYGLSNEDILSKAKAEGLKFGEQAAKGLGIQTELGGYTGLDATQGALGLAGLQRAREAGLSDSAIQSLAKQQGLKFGQEAAKSLGLSQEAVYTPAPQAYSGAPAANYQSGGSLSSFVGSGGTAGAMGASAVGRAMAAGKSASDIRREAAAQGVTFGPAALAMLR